MADLTTRTIASSYKELLKTSSATGLSTSLTVVEDGDATASSLQLSTQAAKFTGALTCDGALTCEGVMTISNTTESGSASQGALVVSGGIRAAKNIRSMGGLFSGTGLTLNEVAGPTDENASGLGLTLRGQTDKNILWTNTGANWKSSENFDLASNKTYKINNINVLSSTALGSGVLSSSLTSVGTINSGVWNGSVVAGTYGGTGVNNANKTITLGGNLTTSGALTFSGAFTTNLTLSANTNLNVPSTGTLATLSGTETLTNKTLNLSNNTLSATSAQIAAAVSDKTGSGALVFAQNPTLVAPTLGAASATSLSLSTPLAIANGGTGQTTSESARNALLPSQAGQNQKFLTTNGTNVSWASPTVSASALTLEQTSLIGDYPTTNPSGELINVSVLSYEHSLESGARRLGAINISDGSMGGSSIPVIAGTTTPALEFSVKNVSPGADARGNGLLSNAGPGTIPNPLFCVTSNFYLGNGSAVTLPNASQRPGTCICVFNRTGAPLKVYPGTGATIEGSVEPFVLQTGRRQFFICLSSNNWSYFLTGDEIIASGTLPFTSAQYFPRTTLTESATIAWDLKTKQVTSVTLTAARTLGNPSNMLDGAFYVLAVKQDATGGRSLSYENKYYFSGGLPSLNTDPNAVSVLTFFCMDGFMYGSTTQNFSQV